MCTHYHTTVTMYILSCQKHTHTHTLRHAIIHVNSIYFHPLSASHKCEHSYEEPINADGDMYAAHICHMSLPWQHQLPWLPEACFCSVMGFGYYRIASYLCAEKHPFEDRLQSNNTPPFDLISRLITDKLLALGENYLVTGIS